MMVIILMMKELIIVDVLDSIGLYLQGVVLGDKFYVFGQGFVDFEMGEVVDGMLVEQMM